MDEDTCIDGPEGCSGETLYRMSLSGTWQSYPRCDHHWYLRTEQQHELAERYPEMYHPEYCTCPGCEGDW